MKNSKIIKRISVAAAVAGILTGNAESILSSQWYFTRQISTENSFRIPDKSKKFTLDKNGIINLDTVDGKGRLNDECIIYNQLESPKAQTVAIGIGADWWSEAFLNGNKVFSTLPDGNVSPVIASDNHHFFLKLNKGKNLLAVKIRRGSAGSWLFACAQKTLSSLDAASPLTITVDPGKVIGRIKPMNAVNNGPTGSRGRENVKYWSAAKIPYARNHDASFYSGYGGEHTVDVHAIFPDFSKDPTDPASYHFSETDRYTAKILASGTKVFYRLGSKIEHAPEKYGTRVPADFKKWAVICEHIIRHYNEGWANGFKYNIKYWEIWNEPDLGCGSKVKPTWQGTTEEFCELYKTAATHLKKCFPKLKIGGPALAGDRNWMIKFLTGITSGNERAPMDFFSWHRYDCDPVSVANLCSEIRRTLDSFGYTKAESILNEWNYIRGWRGDDFLYSVKTIIGMKGAAYAAAVMLACQDRPLEMLMYYDARPSVFNGLFDFYTHEPLKTYYACLLWSKLADMKKQIFVDTQNKIGVFAVGASDGKKTGVMISRYFDADRLPAALPLTISVKDADLSGAKLYLLDENRSLTEVPFDVSGRGKITFDMKANTVAYLEF